MRILYFSRSYTPHDHRFLSSLAKTEHEVHYLKLEADRRQTEDRPVPESVHQIPWSGGQREIRWRDLPRRVLDLRRILRQVRPDLIHAGPIQSCAFIAVLTGFRPVLAMSWGYDLVQDADRNRFMRWVTGYTLKHSAFFVSDADVSRSRAIAFGMAPERTAIFPWGTDLDHFAPQPFKRPAPAAFTVFCNRSWEPIYGVDVLARAFVRVAADHPEIDLILLGGGSQGPAIRQILMKGGVLERVHFGGQVAQKDLPGWYHRADLYVSPSHVDGSSVSLMEALASGLPCLVSDIPGNREWIEHGTNGWLFRDGNVDDLAEKIAYAVKNRPSLEEIGAAGRQTAEQKADWKKNFGKLLSVYERLAAEEHR